MRIVHVNHHLSWAGGIETYLLSLVPRLEELGHEVLLAYGAGDGTLVRHSRQFPGLNETGSAVRRGTARDMSRWLQSVKPDVVHIHNLHNTGAVAACLDQAPTLLHGHDYRWVCPASSFYYRAKQAICEQACGPTCFTSTVTGRCLSLRPPYVWSYYNRVRFIARNAPRFAKVLANSRYMRDRFVQAGFDGAQIDVLHYYCPTEAIGRTWPLPARPTILFVGRGATNKGYRYFVEALGLLPGAVQGLMVGSFSPEAKAEIDALASRQGCRDRLEIRPWASRDAIRDIYASATVAVVPSIWAEPFGLVGPEAFSNGVPVVASDVGGVRDWLIDGQNGRLAPPKDAAALARAIAEILDAPDQGLSMGANGCELVSAKFSTDRHLQNLLALYGAACGSPAAVSAS